jgi:hypothetical protein
VRAFAQDFKRIARSLYAIFMRQYIGGASRLAFIIRIGKHGF